MSITAGMPRPAAPAAATRTATPGSAPAGVGPDQFASSLEDALAPSAQTASTSGKPETDGDAKASAVSPLQPAAGPLSGIPGTATPFPAAGFAGLAGIPLPDAAVSGSGLDSPETAESTPAGAAASGAEPASPEAASPGASAPAATTAANASAAAAAVALASTPGASTLTAVAANPAGTSGAAKGAIGNIAAATGAASAVPTENSVAGTAAASGAAVKTAAPAASGATVKAAVPAASASGTHGHAPALPVSAVSTASGAAPAPTTAAPDSAVVSTSGTAAAASPNAAGSPGFRASAFTVLPAGADNAAAAAPATAAPAAAGAMAETAAPGPVPTLPPLPSQAPVSGAAAMPAAAPVPAAPAPPALLPQVSQPLFSLGTAPQGEHVMTLSITPDNLGPVTVRAHVGADGVRIELFAPSEAGREALRTLMTDLRRDLAGSGMNANLSLSAQDTPGEGTERRDDETEPGSAKYAAATPERTPADPAPRTYRPGFPASASTIDFLA